MKEKIKRKNSLENTVIEVLGGLNIQVECLGKSLAEDYKKCWITEFAPKDSSIKEIKKCCLSKNCHLWYIFSFEYVSAAEYDNAKEKFNQIKKDNCIVYFEDDKYMFKLTNAGALTADSLDTIRAKLHRYLDIFVTAGDFSWTYCHNHENGWIGPYFLKRMC